MTKKIPIKEYKEMFEKLKGSLRVSSSDIPYWSGQTSEERAELIEKAFNPELPQTIQMYTSDGIITYVPEYKGYKKE